MSGLILDPAEICYLVLNALILLLAMVLAVACGGANRSIGYPQPAPSPAAGARVARAIDILARLERDGWLDEFRSGRCQLLDPEEAVPGDEPPPPPIERDDVIGALARKHGPECAPTA